MSIFNAFSRWVELFPTKSTTAAETASMILNHVGRFGSPEVIHSDQVPAFHNKLVTELVVEENNLLPRHILARRIESLSVLIKRCYDIQPYSGQSSRCSSAERARIHNRQDLSTSWQPSSKMHHGLVTTKARIVGKRTRLSCMWTSFMTI